MALPDEVLFDVRLIDRHLTKGQTNGKDYQKFLKAQEDLSEGAITVDYDALTATGAMRNKKTST